MGQREGISFSQAPAPARAPREAVVSIAGNLAPCGSAQANPHNGSEECNHSEKPAESRVLPNIQRANRIQHEGTRF